MPARPNSIHLIAVLLLSLVLSRAGYGQSVVVGVIGDFGAAVEGPASATNELAVANLVKRWNPDFVLTLGDNNYPGGAASTIDANIGQFYHEFIHPYTGAYGNGALSNRFFPCLGNHDWVQNGQPSIDYFALPGNERYYRYRASPYLEWFALNSNADVDGTSPTSTQGVWLRNAMTNSTARWKIVYFHHPAYSAVLGGAGNAYMRWPFAQWGASLVLAGHEHYYARIQTNGIQYIINGLGGDDIHGFATAGPGVVAHYDSDFGAMRIEATATNLVSHFVNRQNVILDTLVLGESAANPFLLAMPADQTVPGGRRVQFSVHAAGTPPLRYQWLSNSVPLAQATNTAFIINSVQPVHEAEYAVVVTSGNSSRQTPPARLALLRQPLISLQPRSVSTNSGGTVSFRVGAEGAGILRYQWQREGAILPGATSSNLVLTDVSLALAGEYAVRVTDDLGSVLSSSATLTVLVRPMIRQSPVGQAAVEGDTITWSVAAEGALPMSYSWRHDGQIVTNIVLHSSTCFWAMANVQLSDAGRYQVGIINITGPAPAGLTPPAYLVVLPDRDRDRLPDDWEIQYGFNPDDPADGNADPDADGATNLQERVAGTDPLSAPSHLRMEPPVALGDGRWQLQFSAMSNRTYVVEYCDFPSAFSWRALTDIPATESERQMTIVDRPPVETASRFYRLVTPRP